MNKLSLPASSPSVQPFHFVRGRKTTTALLAVIVCSSFFCRLALNSLQVPLQAGMHLNDNQIALVLGTAMAVPGVVGGIPVGLLVDRFNRARLLNLFCLLNFLGTLFTALSSNLPALFFSRAIVGFSTAAVAITVPSLLADLFPRSQRGRGSMVYGVSQVGGMAAAFATGGLFVALFGSPDMWRSGMVAMSIPLLGVLLLSLLLPEQKRMEIALKRPSLAKSGVELWNFRAVFAPLLIGVVAIGGADGAALVWGIPIFSRSFGVTAGYGNSVMGIALVIGGLLGPVLGGMGADRCLRSGGATRAMALLATLAILSGVTGLFPLAPGAVLASVSLTLFFLVGSMVISVALTLLTVLLPNELRGFSVSVMSVTEILISFGVAPSLVSITAAQIGGSSSVGIALAIISAIASLISGVVFFLGRGRLERRPPEFEPSDGRVSFQ